MSQDADFKDLPLGELWHHTSWKARQIGYDRAAAELEKGIGTVPALDDLRSAASDSNAIALDSGIKLLIAACHALPSDDLRTGLSIRQAVAKSLAEKGLGASKPSAKQNALEALLVLVEVGDPDGVVDDVLPLLAQRAPKLVASGTLALVRIFGDFGSPVADPRPVLKVLPGLFGNADRSVRAAASDLAVALFRWVGEPAMMQVLGQLKPVQLNELKAQFAQIDLSAPVKRQTRKQAAQDAAQIQSVAGAEAVDGMETDLIEAGTAQGAAELDPWDLASQEDVISSIGGDFWAGLESAKWKERHEALAPLLQRLEKMPRLNPSADYSRLVGELLRIAGKDLNQLCATEAVQILTHLASGLRQAFQASAPRVLETVVERFKEKKPASVDTVTKCIDTVFVFVLGARLQPVLEPVLRIGLVHKTPTVKLESTRYLAHLLRETPTAPTPQEMAEITSLAVKLMGDGSDPVRAAAASVLAALVKICGAPSMARALDNLDEHKRKRVMEAVSTTTVKAQTAATAPPRAGGGPASGRPAGAAAPGRAAPARRAAGPQQPSRQPLNTAPPVPMTRSALANGGAQAPNRAPPSVAVPRLQFSQSQQQSQQQQQLRAPATPAASRGLQSRRPSDEEASHMSFSSLASPSPPRNDTKAQGGRPSVSSTPKIVKRSLAATEFTPARGVEPHRRRMHSPAKVDAAGDDFSDDIAQVAQLKAQLDQERRLRHGLEAKLATTQVEHEREVRHLSEKIAALRVELQSAREDYAVELQHSRRAAVDADDVRGHLDTLKLEEPVAGLRAPRTRDEARGPAARPTSMFGMSSQRPRLVPIANQDTKGARPTNSSVAAAAERNRTGSEAWERAVTMTHDIRERVERLKARRQPESMP